MIIDTRDLTVISWAEMIEEKMVEVEARISEKKEKAESLSLGVYEIDHMLQGLQKSDLVILAGETSVGKTTLALSFVENIALGIYQQASRPVAVFSLATKANSVICRMISHSARVSRKKLAAGKVSGAEYRKLKTAADALRCAPIYVEDTGNDVMEMRTRARQLKREFDIKFIVVDYLQLVEFGKYRRKGFQCERAAISRALKSMAKELKIPILVLSQLCRAPGAKNAIPRLTDLRDSGGIERDADIVMMLRRPHQYEKDKVAEEKRPVIMDIVKNRRGPVGETHFRLEYGIL